MNYHAKPKTATHLQPSLYEFHLPKHDIITRNLCNGASREQRMTSPLIEKRVNSLVEL